MERQISARDVRQLEDEHRETTIRLSQERSIAYERLIKAALCCASETFDQQADDPGWNYEYYVDELKSRARAYLVLDAQYEQHISGKNADAKLKELQDDPNYDGQGKTVSQEEHDQREMLGTVGWMILAVLLVAAGWFLQSWLLP